MRSVVLCMGVAVLCLEVLSAGSSAYVERVSNQTGRTIHLGNASTGVIALENGKNSPMPTRLRDLQPQGDGQGDSVTAKRQRLGELSSRIDLTTQTDYSPPRSTSFTSLGYLEYKCLKYLHDGPSLRRLRLEGPGQEEPVRHEVVIFCRIVSPDGQVLASFRSEKILRRPNAKYKYALHLILKGSDLRQSVFRVLEIAPDGNSHWVPEGPN